MEKFKSIEWNSNKGLKGSYCDKSVINLEWIFRDKWKTNVKWIILNVWYLSLDLLGLQSDTHEMYQWQSTEFNGRHFSNKNLLEIYYCKQLFGLK